MSIEHFSELGRLIVDAHHIMSNAVLAQSAPPFLQEKVQAESLARMEKWQADCDDLIARMEHNRNGGSR